jgi:hypothetical protein
MDPTVQGRENKTNNRYLITDTKKGLKKTDHLLQGTQTQVNGDRTDRPFTTRNTDTRRMRQQDRPFNTRTPVG